MFTTVGQDMNGKTNQQDIKGCFEYKTTIDFS